MKAAKIIGERLIKYIEDGVNWKDHKDVVLDYWKEIIAPKSNVPPKNIKKAFYVNELDEITAKMYEDWFSEYDFQNEDRSWIKFIDGTLNIFYKTSNPEILSDEEWFIYLLNSEDRATEIVENQTFHGNPDINTFWKISKNGKAEEVAGRKNGYLFTDRLEDITKKVTKFFQYGIVFKARESVSLEYLDGTKSRKKCINWASHADDIFLVKVTKSGKLQIIPSLVKDEARVVPEGKISTSPMDGRTLTRYLNKNYMDLFGKEQIETEQDALHDKGVNARQTAVNTMHDEEIQLRNLIPNLDAFIAQGNVDDNTRESNKEMRIQASKKKIEQDRASKRAQKEMEKQKAKDMRMKLQKFKKSLEMR